MKGGVEFVIRSSMAERLMEKAMEEDICFLSVSRSGDREITCRIQGIYEKKLTALLDRFSIRYEIISRRGSSAFYAFVKKKIALIAASVLALLALVLISDRIWVIEISGDNEYIRPYLLENGIVPGIRKKSIDPTGLSHMLAYAFDEYAHIGVKVSGVYLMIEAVNEDRAPDVYVKDDIRNLYADSDGVIDSINVFAGQAMVQTGQTVKRGQLLILGEEKRSADGETTPIRAEGSVIARTWTTGTAECERMHEERIFTGRERTEIRLECPFFIKTLTEASPFPLSETRVSKTPIGKLFAPIDIVYTTYLEYTVSKTPVSDSENEAVGIRALAEARKTAAPNANEYKSTVNYEITDTSIKANAVIEWKREIAAEKQGG